MRLRENYTPFAAAGLGLTLAILAAFQVYLFREPGRIQAAEAADLAEAQAAGRQLYTDNCVSCHGENGEGGVGPALNSHDLLQTTPDLTFAGLIRTGVPGALMPAWGQAHGGPFTDEQVAQIVAFIRAWEPTAPEIVNVSTEPDPVRGAVIFSNTCFICHGENGRGTDRAPKLNDPALLKDFDDAWYRATIANGRPAKGMPTWGTVLAPGQINDLVALLAAWRDGQTVTPPVIPVERLLISALFAVRQFDALDAHFYLTAALAQASGTQAQGIRDVRDLLEAKNWSQAEAGLIGLLPTEEIGRQLFVSYCAPCHGVTGTGGLGRNLHANAFVQSKNDDELILFLLAGRPATAMDGFEGVLSRDDLGYIIALLRTWQK